jgi:hypothetical protein
MAITQGISEAAGTEESQAGLPEKYTTECIEGVTAAA